MIFKNRKYKSKAAILLYSLLGAVALSGCSTSEKRIILQPPVNTPLGDAQGQYEHIPKPVAFESDPVDVQMAEFKAYVKHTVQDIDEYKRKVNGSGVRYGKNRIAYPDTQTSIRSPATKIPTKHKNIETKLYPKIESGKPIKSTALYGV